mgnify:CR=1 FL=1
MIGKVEYDCLHLWVSICGSQLEAMNYCYTLSNVDKDGLGLTCSGYVNTLDENPNEIITEQDLFRVGLENATKMSNLQKMHNFYERYLQTEKFLSFLFQNIIIQESWFTF